MGLSAKAAPRGEVCQAGAGVAAPAPVVVAASALVLTLLLGNLTGLEWALNGLASVMRGTGLPAFDYWAASRVSSLLP